MSDRNEFIPTPEELEEGKLKRGDRKSRREGTDDGQPKQRLKMFRRRKGVGRRRTFVEPETSPASPSRPASDVEPPSEEGTAKAHSEDSSAARVESVLIRPRKPKRVAPKYEPNSPQAIFHGKARDKGHEMGELAKVPGSTNWTALCTVCGMKGELVIQHEENYANLTYEYYRGPAIKQTCPSASVP